METTLQIRKLEDNNNIAVNVVGYENNLVDEPFFFIARASTKHDVKEIVNVLQIYNEFTTHYVLISNFSAFLQTFTKNTNKKFACFRCWHGYVTVSVLMRLIMKRMQGYASHSFAVEFKILASYFLFTKQFSYIRFTTKQRLLKHGRDCRKFDAQITVMPEETSLKYKQFRHEVEVPISIGKVKRMTIFFFLNSAR